MKHGEQLTISNVKVGQKVKIAIIRSWAETPYQTPYSRGNYCWVKEKIVGFHDKSIIVNTRYKYHKRCIHSFIENLFIVAEKNGSFNRIYLQLK